MAKKHFLKNSYLLKRKIGRSFGGNLVIVIVLTFVAAVQLLPMIYTIGNAFKPLDELFVFPPRFFVRRPTLENFRTLFTLQSGSVLPLTRYFLNTLFITVSVILGHIVLSTVTAYVLEKRDFPGRQLLFKMVVTALMFGGGVTAIPLYLIYSKLGWIDTYWAVILPSMGGTLGLYLMKQFMSGVPNSLLESAKLDGAGELKIILKIVIPLVRPAWLTLVILTIQSVWNLSPTDIIFSEEKKTLAYATSQLVAGGMVRAGASSALSLLMLSVPVCVFIFTQSKVIQTMASSGIKE